MIVNVEHHEGDLSYHFTTGLTLAELRFLKNEAGINTRDIIPAIEDADPDFFWGITVIAAARAGWTLTAEDVAALPGHTITIDVTPTTAEEAAQTVKVGRAKPGLRHQND